jgi:plasmid stabilization system protein ParE
LDFRIEISEPALTDFQEIVEYSWNHFPHAAERLPDELLNHIEMLATYPHMGAPVIEAEGRERFFIRRL